MFPSSFISTMMNATEPVEQIRQWLEPLLTGDIFLVSIKIKPTNNIKVYLDADSGLGIDQCSRINRALYKTLEEQGMYPDGNFSLEVSSPGVDEPLKMLRQYKKNIGRELLVQFQDDSQRTGRLTDVLDDSVVLEFTEGKGKKAELKKEEIAFAQIKKAIVQIKF